MAKNPDKKPEIKTTDLEKSSKDIHHTNLRTAYYRSFSDIPNAKGLSELVKADEASAEWMKEEGFENHKSRIPFFEARYKAIDALINRSGVKQVVEFAAGLTTRGINNPQWNYVYTEQDTEALEQMKDITKRLSKGPKGTQPHFVKFDAISGDGMEQIISCLREEPVAVVHEGLITYYPFETKAKIALNAKQLLKRFGGVYITPDIHNKQLFAKTQTSTNYLERDRRRSKKFGRDFASMRFNTEKEALSFFSNLGFGVKIYKLGDLVSKLSSVDVLYADPKEQKSVSSITQERQIWYMTLGRSEPQALFDVNTQQK